MTADGSRNPVALATAYGTPPLSGRIRVEPEDFFVEELLGFEPDGNGAHVLLAVEKRGANSGWVAAQLARAAGLHVRDVGYCGQKDRHAVTRQAYTLPWPAAASVGACLDYRGEGYRVLSAVRHGRKLRPGAHRGNRFVIRVRDARGDRGGLEDRMQRVAAGGVPNYFGPQRFGRRGDNLLRARDWAAGRESPRDRVQRGFALSAARAELFNRVLHARVERGDWNRLLTGEAVMLDGRRSFFRTDAIDVALEARCAAHDVHPSGPLCGRGESPASAEARAVEDAALADEAALRALVETQGLEHERRPLRLAVRGLRWEIDDEVFTVSFELPRGAFATAVLHELVLGASDRDEAGED
jgi:tRNA pseudouridine13 synthase